MISSDIFWGINVIQDRYKETFKEDTREYKYLQIGTPQHMRWNYITYGGNRDCMMKLASGTEITSTNPMDKDCKILSIK